ncbi:MAG: hypothetical protein IKT00_08930 [Prevotella sp.]|nr:hypothetical protein [Prevotella sp.]
MKKLFLLALMALLVACSKETKHVNAAYYWSTNFSSDSTMTAFIQEQHISRLYVRYFDVVIDEHDNVRPNATIQFQCAMPDSVEVIPCVFITNESMAKCPDNLDSLIYQRVRQMNSTHDIADVKELQIDCDWSQRTQKTYFDMLRRLRGRAHADGWQLSCTIRLHQLAMEAPPVDRGVLMMYNTGDVRKMERNPILDLRDVQPYLRHLDKYSLPLATAYPSFEWSILYRSHHYVGIMHDDDALTVLPGDTIIRHEVPLETVLKVKEMVDEHLPNANDEIIIFELSKNNIQRITQNHYEKVYHP